MRRLSLLIHAATSLLGRVRLDVVEHADMNMNMSRNRPGGS
jgi:hypothetical protein